MSRSTRALRGTTGAFAVTAFAAASHALAGGSVTWLAVVATTVLAMPLCVALAGRLGSLWRLSIAVGISQFVYHWTFSGLGLPAIDTSRGVPVLSAHAQHLAQLERFAPAVASSSADALMWVAHGVAAVATIALLHQGERAFLGLLRIVSRVLAGTPLPLGVTPGMPRLARHRVGPTSCEMLRDQLFSLSAISHRGPPLSFAH